MKIKLIAISTICLFSLKVKAQSDSVKVSVSVTKKEINYEEKCEVVIKVASNSKKEIKVIKDPIYADCDTEFAHVKFCLEKIIDSCFQRVGFDYDLFDLTKRELKTLIFLETYTQRFDLLNLFSLHEGIYRLKVSYTYLVGSSVNEVDSNWDFFIVSKK